METESIRASFLGFRETVTAEGHRDKDSTGALVRLLDRYASLPAAHRAIANDVVCEWMQSPDEALRFDALAIIEAFPFREAAPILHRVAGDLAHSQSPGAPYEIRKIMRALERIQASADSASSTAAP